MKTSSSSRARSCVALEAASLLLKNLGTPFSLECREDILSGRHGRYLDRELNPDTYLDPDEFRCDYLALNLLRKYESLSVDVDRVAAALVKFHESERSCERAELNLRALRSGRVELHDPRHWIFHSARRKIASLLGPFSWDQCSRFFSFGPGASVGVPRTRGDSYYKYGSKRPSVTPGCLALAEAAIRWSPMWFNHIFPSEGGSRGELNLVSGNKVVTVPKSAKIDRIIAIEPLLNMYIQKGIGGVIRRRLKRVGINLDSQRRNQRLAAFAARVGFLGTIDLSSASDCVSLALVEDLLPSDWVDAIKQCRSPVGTLPDGTVVRYRKVSSMGNGFTFELESLIFWALCQSCLDFQGGKVRRCAVYGDDIIVPARSVPIVRLVLEFAGFSFNSEKSFYGGKFRESCGKHFFGNVDVTPLSIKKRVDSVERLFWLANSFKRFAHQWNGTWGCDGRWRNAYDHVVQCLPLRLRRPSTPLYINGGAFDGGLGGDFDEVLPRRARFGLDAWTFLFYRREYRKIGINGVPAILRWFCNSERRSPRAECDIAGDKIPSQQYRLIRSVGSVQQS